MKNTNRVWTSYCVQFSLEREENKGFISEALQNSDLIGALASFLFKRKVGINHESNIQFYFTKANNV
jgi:hypothetical protein